MSLPDLALLYALAGIGCAAVRWRSQAGFVDLALTGLLWPLYAPFALGDERRAPAAARGTGVGADDRARRIGRAEGVADHSEER